MPNLTVKEAAEALLPCPWCGAQETTFEEGSTFRWRILRCAPCGASVGEVRVQTMGEGTTPEWEAAAYAEAVKEWNTRTPDPQVKVLQLALAEARRWVDFDVEVNAHNASYMAALEYRAKTLDAALAATQPKESQNG